MLPVLYRTSIKLRVYGEPIIYVVQITQINIPCCLGSGMLTPYGVAALSVLPSWGCPECDQLVCDCTRVWRVIAPDTVGLRLPHHWSKFVTQSTGGYRLHRCH